MSAPYRHFESWEHDKAHLAVTQWIREWRLEHPGVPLPPSSFGAHLGREALELAAGEIGQVEIQRIFSTYGHDGVCMCGLKPGDRIPETTKGGAA